MARGVVVRLTPHANGAPEGAPFASGTRRQFSMTVGTINGVRPVALRR